MLWTGGQFISEEKSIQELDLNEWGTNTSIIKISHPGKYPEFLLATVTFTTGGKFGILFCRVIIALSVPKFKIVIYVGSSAKLLQIKRRNPSFTWNNRIREHAVCKKWNTYFSKNLPWKCINPGRYKIWFKISVLESFSFSKFGKCFVHIISTCRIFFLMLHVVSNIIWIYR